MSCDFCNRIGGCHDGYLDFDPFVPEWGMDGGLRYNPKHVPTVNPDMPDHVFKDGEAGVGWRIQIGYVDLDEENRPTIPIKFCPWCGTELPDIDNEVFEIIQSIIPKHSDEMDLDEAMGLRYQTRLGIETKV
jgi:hypothetical protein